MRLMRGRRIQALVLVLVSVVGAALIARPYINGLSFVIRAADVQGVHDVLDHDQGAIDDDAEVERSKAQEIGGNAGEVHADEGEEQRERNRDGGQKRRAHTAEKHTQDGQDNDQTLEERMRDGVQRVVDQVRAVVDGDHLHAGRQSRRVQLRDGLMNPIQDLAGIFTSTHQDDPLDPIRLVADGEEAGPWR